jgi:hypothetical protein
MMCDYVNGFQLNGMMTVKGGLEHACKKAYADDLCNWSGALDGLKLLSLRLSKILLML